jgi:hypothetical protein
MNEDNINMIKDWLKGKSEMSQERFIKELIKDIRKDERERIKDIINQVFDYEVNYTDIEDKPTKEELGILSKLNDNEFSMLERYFKDDERKRIKDILENGYY